VNIDQLLHLHERSIFNSINNHENSQCIVANQNVHTIDKELYNDLKQAAQQWYELYQSEKALRLAQEQEFQAKITALEEEIKRLRES
jgi:hypothetical protein